MPKAVVVARFYGGREEEEEEGCPLAQLIKGRLLGGLAQRTFRGEHSAYFDVGDVARSIWFYLF